MSLIAARSAIVGGGAKLPYDAEVECLEGTGTQWIDTGMYPTNNATTIVDAKLTRVSVAGATCHIHIVDSKESWNSRARTIGYWGTSPGGTSRIAVGYGSAGAAPASYAAATDYTTARMKYTIERNVFTVGSIYAQTFAEETFTSKLSMKVLTNAAVSVSATAAKLYGWQHYEGDVLLQDCIPVRFTNEFGQTEGAMYDRANPTVGTNRDGTPRNDGLYLNRGTGSFVIGADK
jgi:hypothetical protein